MENKALTQAKNTVAERHGYGNMETLLNENWTDEDIVNEVAIEYNRIMSEWVDVKERLPEIQKDVLVTNSKDKWVVCGFMEKTKQWYNTFDNSGCSIYPTHWQPLPAPPQK